MRWLFVLLVTLVGCAHYVRVKPNESFTQQDFYRDLTECRQGTNTAGLVYAGGVYGAAAADRQIDDCLRGHGCVEQRE